MKDLKLLLNYLTHNHLINRAMSGVLLLGKQTVKNKIDQVRFR